jgi:hypothetical protein
MGREDRQSVPLPAGTSRVWVRPGELTVVMQQLIPMFRDPSLPAFLQPRRWAIEGAFEESLR